MATVLWAVLLYGIICKVDEVVVKVGRIHRVWLTRCSQIPLAEEEHISLVRHRHPNPYVEFAWVYQQWTLDILLYYESLRADSGLGNSSACDELVRRRCAFNIALCYSLRLLFRRFSGNMVGRRITDTVMINHFLFILQFNRVYIAATGGWVLFVQSTIHPSQICTFLYTCSNFIVPRGEELRSWWLCCCWRPVWYAIAVLFLL